MPRHRVYINTRSRPTVINNGPVDVSRLTVLSRPHIAILGQSLAVYEGSPLEDENIHNIQQIRSKVADFRKEALSIKTGKNYFKMAYPIDEEFSQNVPNSIQEWCTFCLGSKLCAKIYNKMYDEPSEEIAGHIPSSNVIFHLDNKTLFMLLQHFHEWFLSLGMEEALGEWVYAVVSCMDTMLPPRIIELIETFYDDCKQRISNCNDNSEKSRLYKFLGIFDTFFPLFSSSRIWNAMST